VSRLAGSMLTAAGLTELVTDNLEQYEATISTLAQQPRQLQRLKQALTDGAPQWADAPSRLILSLESELLRRLDAL
jgi:predicted O-linked N-acetylglucosamine transferase (SPINDLY family)